MHSDDKITKVEGEILGEKSLSEVLKELRFRQVEEIGGVCYVLHFLIRFCVTGIVPFSQFTTIDKIILFMGASS